MEKKEILLNNEKHGMDDLLLVMDILRGENGCPWDREQDHKSIRMNFIEEVYEACEAIDNDDPDLLKEELGDVLLQVVFHSKMEDEKGTFGFSDVTDGIVKKLIFRHPHIFGDVSASTSDKVLENWEKLKAIEKNQKSTSEKMDKVAKSLPALMRCQKVQKKAAGDGFDFRDISEVFDKIYEEISELKSAIDNADENNINEEFGDLLFSCVNLARFLHLNSESALTLATDKFYERYKRMENNASKAGIKFSDLSFDEQNILWDKAKLDD